MTDCHDKPCCRTHGEADAMAAILADLLPMVQDWADGEDDDGEGSMPATAMAERIQAVLDRINGRD